MNGSSRAEFSDLHVAGKPLVMPNPWDVGSARMLASMGAKALGSTSAGAAFVLGRREGTLSFNEMLDAACALGDATGLPVSADLESCGGDAPKDVARAIKKAAARTISGASIEDISADGRMFDLTEAVDRVAAAVEAAKGTGLVITARAEAMQWPEGDLENVCKRIAGFAQVGADVVYAPGLGNAEMVRAVLSAAGDVPVNMLVGSNKGDFSVRSLADLGVARISTGAALARAAYGAVISMMRDVLDDGQITYPATTATFDEIEALLRK
ncbi:MAG: isocitrate lyase/phosphoenolpyruvate mutase family protein [Tateyamaria sp.]|uniref:isocitrate lyase/PEP mutase family protein n=1 Tax=Tateyamaria sp. TaxID=1929288 RepID=UPI00327ABB27